MLKAYFLLVAAAAIYPHHLKVRMTIFEISVSVTLTGSGISKLQIFCSAVVVKVDISALYDSNRGFKIGCNRTPQNILCRPAVQEDNAHTHVLKRRSSN